MHIYTYMYIYNVYIHIYIYIHTSPGPQRCPWPSAHPAWPGTPAPNNISCMLY